MDLPVDRGAYLSFIFSDGPSSKAGLRGTQRQSTYEGRTVEIGGDIIIAINDTPIYSFDDLLVYIALKANPGDEVKLTVLRDGKEQVIPLKLEPRPNEMTEPFTPEISPEE
jgi:S1-C subfamily serine protease